MGPDRQPSRIHGTSDAHAGGNNAWGNSYIYSNELAIQISFSFLWEKRAEGREGSLDLDGSKATSFEIHITKYRVSGDAHKLLKKPERMN